jgi:hypothetical protein
MRNPTCKIKYIVRFAANSAAIIKISVILNVTTCCLV